VFTTIVATISRASCQLTGESTPRRNCISEKPIVAAAVAAAPTASGVSPCAGSRSSRRRPAPYPMDSINNDVTPRVCTSAMSISSPMPNPIVAPASEPASRPTAITTSGARSALTPSSVICDTAAICTITATRPSAASRSAMLEPALI
jgi:hypothetical protein